MHFFLAKLALAIFSLFVFVSPVFCEKVYDFSDAAQMYFNSYNPSNAYSPANNKNISGTQFVPAGAVLTIMLNGEVSSDWQTVGEQITAQLTSDFSNNGVLIAPEGSILLGLIADIKNPDVMSKDAQVGLEFNQLFLPDGTVYQINTNRLYAKMDSILPSVVRRDVIMYPIIDGIRNYSIRRDFRSALKTILSSSARSANYVVRQKGSEIIVPEGTSFQVRLLSPIEAHPYKF